MRAARAALFLATREQRADARATLCFALAFAAMLTPLMTLLALKEGVIQSMMDDLVGHPSTLEILPVGAGRYDADFFQAAAALPGAGFVVPRTRTISARLLGLRSRDTRKVLRGPALIPTGPGDPVTMAGPLSLDGREIVLSAEAARKLGVAVGAVVEGWIERRQDGRTERAEAVLTVKAISPGANYAREAVFAPFELLVAVENFLDGHGEAGESWIETALEAERSSFASFRAYATSIHDVLALRDGLEALGARLRVRSEEIVVLLRLDRALGWLFAVIAGVAGAGFLLSLTASLRANVERLRPTLSMFRLLGAEGATRFLIPVVQSAVIVALGTLFAFAGYVLIAVLIEERAQSILGQGSVLALGPVTLAWLVAVLAAGSLVAALAAAREAVAVGPEEVVRRV